MSGNPVSHKRKVEKTLNLLIFFCEKQKCAFLKNTPGLCYTYNSSEQKLGLSNSKMTQIEPYNTMKVEHMIYI